MNDPHVVSLTYRRKPSEEVSYDSPPPLTFKCNLFSGRLDGDVLILTPNDHYPSIELAQGPAERFLRAWELDAELRRGRGSIAFDPRPCSLRNSIKCSLWSGFICLGISRACMTPPKLINGFQVNSVGSLL